MDVSQVAQERRGPLKIMAGVTKLAKQTRGATLHLVGVTGHKAKMNFYHDEWRVVREALELVGAEPNGQGGLRGFFYAQVKHRTGKSDIPCLNVVDMPEGNGFRWCLRGLATPTVREKLLIDSWETFELGQLD